MRPTVALLVATGMSLALIGCQATEGGGRGGGSAPATASTAATTPIAEYTFPLGPLQEALQPYHITPTSGLPPAQISHWQVGDQRASRFAGNYSGQTETVTAVNGDMVHWQSSTGWTWQIPGDWYFQGTGVGPEGEVVTASYDGDLNTLFPLQVGKSAFATVTSTAHGEEYVEGRSCFVVAEETVTVDQTPYDTYRIECVSSTDHAQGGQTRRVAHQHILWYSPQVRDVVLRARLHNGEVRDIKEAISWSRGGAL